MATQPPTTAPRPTPPCPWCKTPKAVYDHAMGWQCNLCGRIFDSDPDEGGSHSDRNPAVRLEREERAAQRRAEQLARLAATAERLRQQRNAAKRGGLGR